MDYEQTSQLMLMLYKQLLQQQETPASEADVLEQDILVKQLLSQPLWGIMQHWLSTLKDIADNDERKLRVQMMADLQKWWTSFVQAAWAHRTQERAHASTSHIPTITVTSPDSVTPLVTPAAPPSSPTVVALPAPMDDNKYSQPPAAWISTAASAHSLVVPTSTTTTTTSSHVVAAGDNKVANGVLPVSVDTVTSTPSTKTLRASARQTSRESSSTQQQAMTVSEPGSSAAAVGALPAVTNATVNAASDSAMRPKQAAAQRAKQLAQERQRQQEIHQVHATETE